VTDHRIILASGSPRRQELLATAGLRFEVIVPDVDESVTEDASPEVQAMAIARRKADAVSVDDAIVIAADTLVVLDGIILGKPADAREAVDMLKFLSGRTHAVITGVCIRRDTDAHVFAETTQVTFDQLSDADIMRYVDECTPYDKAGAYAIQEWIGMIGISGIVGDYYNVVGLPVKRVLDFIRKITAPEIR
jgi:septum formation protein